MSLFDDFKNILIIIAVTAFISSYIYICSAYNSISNRVDNLESSFDKYICRECGSLKNK